MMAAERHTFADQAKRSELPQLNTWRRGTPNYLALWMGLRGENLRIDREEVDAIQCSLTRRWWLFGAEDEEQLKLQSWLDGRYQKHATPEWCWKRGKELSADGHWLAESASRGEVPESPFFPIGSNRYLAMWQGLRGDTLDVEENETFTAVFCSKLKKWWVFTPNTLQGQKWRKDLQGWLDPRQGAALQEAF